MATNLEIIQVGYADKVNPSLMVASGSCCLIQSGGERILFDTMGPWERDRLVEGLSRHKIHPDDVDYLICSHSHPDHIGNNNLFTKAKVHLVGIVAYEKDKYHLDFFEPLGSYTYKTSRGDEVEVITHENYRLNSHITIEPTPGHTLECASLFIDDCVNYGPVALAGDLFERENDVTDEKIWLAAGTQNADLQRAHRSRVYNRVDYIMPGHGPMFKTKVNKPIRF